MSVHIVDHPIAQHALTALRNQDAYPSRFRRLAHRLSWILAMEATRDLATDRVTVQGPLEAVEGVRLRTDIVVVPVLRAGLGMLEAVLELIPDARVGYIGLQRDESTAVASQYYAKLPPLSATTTVLLIDPMLATGGSAVAALEGLAAAGASDLRLLCIVAAPEGIAAVHHVRPSMPIYTTAVDRMLNAQKYILPGLGDFGDRLYGT